MTVSFCDIVCVGVGTTVAVGLIEATAVRAGSGAVCFSHAKTTMSRGRSTYRNTSSGSPLAAEIRLLSPQDSPDQTNHKRAQCASLCYGLSIQQTYLVVRDYDSIIRELTSDVKGNFLVLYWPKRRKPRHHDGAVAKRYHQSR